MITSFQSVKSEFPSIFCSEVLRNSSPREHLSELRGRILSLEARNRTICDKYKNNFKEAFQSKINTYRLEVLLNRRSQKERGENQRVVHQKQLQQQKRKRVKEQKLERMSSRLYVAETLEQRAERARNRFLQQHTLNQKRRLDNEYKQILRKKNMRGVMFSNRAEIRKEREHRRYMSEIRQREMYAIEMKKELQEIISKEEMLEKLQDELKTLQYKEEG